MRNDKDPHMNMLQNHWMGACVLTALLGVSSAMAQPAAPTGTSPATQPAVGELVEIVITGVEGNVQARADEGKPWVAAKPGMKLTAGAEFRTGPRSRVQFLIEPDQTVTLDRLGTVKVIQAIRDQKKVKTELGMQYGRTRYDIEAAGLEHDSSIRSPSAGLGIRGTKVILYDQAPYKPEARSLTGRAVFSDERGKKKPFGKNKPTAIVSGNESSAETAIENTRVDTRSAPGRSKDETNLLLSAAALGGRDFRDQGILKYIDQARKGTFRDSAIGSLPVGELLDFTLFWRGPAFSDVDLSIISPKGELLGKFNPEVPSSGLYNGNNIANANGSGQESATWTISFPPGKYTVKASLAGSPPPSDVQVTLTAIRDPLGAGQLIGNTTGVINAANPTFTTTVKASRK